MAQLTWRDVLNQLQTMPNESLDHPVEVMDADGDYTTITTLTTELIDFIERPVFEF